jgi:hypothetical protein
MDSRHVFLVKLAHAAEAKETKDIVQTETKQVTKDGTTVTATVLKPDIERTAFAQAFKVATPDFEIIEDTQGIYGVWQ